jgi:hypothetical protein
MNETVNYVGIDLHKRMYLAAFEMGRVSAFFLESRIVLDKKKADLAFFLTS